MDYFSILGLRREPFSNSPDPDLFYLSGQHERCLQRMELAIRLRRGLNVVVGEIGTGKTTLCRELVVRLTPAPEAGPREDSGLQTHLILDPSFNSPMEFLLAVSRMFGLEEAIGERSEWRIKELIKHYLFRRGVDADDTIVLVIDEGQKLPSFCVEILREFLNYETNERKLLQIVIFAQEEFKQILKKRANFSDRINELVHLGPLSFRETRKMIRFRLARSSPNGTPPALFTYSGFRAVHRATGGYPRRIIALCHQVVLSLIIKNRTRADWFVVMTCVNRVTAERKGALRWRWLTGALTAVLCLMALPLVFQHTAQPVRPVSGLDTTHAMPKSRVIVPPPEPGPAAVETASTEEGEDLHELLQKTGAPPLLGSLKVREGETFHRIVRNVYGLQDGSLDRMLARANPHIDDFNKIKAGEIVNLPVASMTPQLPVSRRYWVRIAEAADIEEAYGLLKNHPKIYPPVRLLPSWSRQEGLRFSLVLYNGHEDKALEKSSAVEMATGLPRALAAKVRIITQQQGTVFLKKIIE
jgi:general secretion pathway protein A